MDASPPGGLVAAAVHILPAFAGYLFDPPAPGFPVRDLVERIEEPRPDGQEPAA